MKLNLDFWKKVCLLQGLIIIAAIMSLSMILLGPIKFQESLSNLFMNIAIIDCLFIICFTVYWTLKKDKKEISLAKAINKLHKSDMKLKKTMEERIWIENHPKIHLFNYPYYKLKRILKGENK